MDKEETRKRKAHTKSRNGCANCKLRRVKCDEGNPECNKCVQYGVKCSYNNPQQDLNAAGKNTLQLPGEGSFNFATWPPPKPTGPSSPIKARDPLCPEDQADELEIIESLLGKQIALHESGGKYTIDRDDLTVLKRFIYRTVFTVGTAATVDIYRRKVVQLAADGTPCLMHLVIALTVMHDRYLDSPWSAPPSPKETFHIYHGTAIFGTYLRKPIQDEDRDPLWASAAILGCITVASMDASTPEEAWPLAPPAPTDLDWLKMSDGKKEVWQLVDPLRTGSVFREALMHQETPQQYSHVVPELRLLYPYLTKLYDFDESHASRQEQERDPYHTAASILLRLLELECNHSTIMYFLSFLGHMDPRFRELLQQKDARAMLLLAWWYGKMSQYNVWWQSRRMRLEGRAICIYLERYHAHEDGVLALLDYPKMMMGMYA